MSVGHQPLDDMSLETPLPESASSPIGKDKSAVDPQLNAEQSSPAESQGVAEGEEFPGAANQINSLKRSSPDDREEVGDEERYSKRPKEDDPRDDQATPTSQANIAESAQAEQPATNGNHAVVNGNGNGHHDQSPQADGPSSEASASQPVAQDPAPASAVQPGELSAPAAPASSGPQPTPDNPVQDPSLLPPPNMYIPGSYVPPAKPPLGATKPFIFTTWRSVQTLVRNLKKSKEAFAFLAPVDPVAMGIPHYLQIISKPMDISTVENRLAASNPKQFKPTGPGDEVRYTNVAEVVEDLRQIWANTRIFNGPEHVVSQHADKLEEMFKNSLEKAKLHENGPETPVPERKTTPSIPATQSQQPEPTSARTRRPTFSSEAPPIRRNPSDDNHGESSRPKREIHAPPPKDSTWSENAPQTLARKGRASQSPKMRAAAKAINELMNGRQHQAAAAPFYAPVDPVALNIPSYFDVIKQPMDLSTIQEKLNQGLYDDVQGVHSDIKLMIRNCHVFNPPGTPVHACGTELDKIWKEKWKAIQSTPDELEEDDSHVNHFAAEIEQLERQRAEIDARLDQLYKQRNDKQKARASQAVYHAKPAKTSLGNGKAHPKQHNKPTKNGNVKPRKQEEERVQPLNLQQKQELADKILVADPNVQMQAMEVIRKSMIGVVDQYDEEVELDMDALDPATVRVLYNLVIMGQQPGAQRKPSNHNVNSGGQKKKPGRRPGQSGGRGGKSAQESERVRRLEEELNKLGNGGDDASEGSYDQDDGDGYSEEQYYDEEG